MPANPLVTPVDFVVLAGKKSPGYAYVTGVGMPRKWDDRNGYGLSGVTTFFTGMDLSKPTLFIQLTTAEEFEAFNVWRAVLEPPRLGRRDIKHQIWHPYLEDAQIHEVVILDVQGPEEVGDTGLYMYTIPLKHWRRPKPQVVKPEEDKNTPARPAYQPALEAAKIADKLEEIANGLG